MTVRFFFINFLKTPISFPVRLKLSTEYKKNQSIDQKTKCTVNIFKFV